MYNLNLSEYNLNLCAYNLNLSLYNLDRSVYDEAPPLCTSPLFGWYTLLITYSGNDPSNERIVLVIIYRGTNLHFSKNFTKNVQKI